MKRCLVTGANRGLGFELARQLAAEGHEVVLGCRSRDRGEQAAARIRAEGGAATFLHVDLEDPTTLERAAEHARAYWDRLDVLVHNAGWFGLEREESEAGVERTLAVNVLGPWQLTGLLLPYLDGGRVVQLAGIYAKKGRLHDDLQLVAGWTSRAANHQAQLARVLLTRELARRHPELEAHAVHPGGVLTGAQDALPWYARLLIETVLRPGFRTPEKAALPIVRLALDPLDAPSGSFWARGRVVPPWPALEAADTAALVTALEALPGPHDAGSARIPPGAGTSDG